jgi:small-conductance mechanosensitive channel
MAELSAWLHANNISALLVLATALLLIVTPLAALALNQLLRRLVKDHGRRLHLPYDSALVLTRVSTAAVWLISATLMLNLWGIGPSGLWAVLISAAAVIGVGFLAVWTMVSNVTASLFITIWRPFQLGQTVEILPENLRGRVIDRNFMFTALRDDGGSVLHIPNNLFFQKVFRVSDGSKRSLFEDLEHEDAPALTTAERRS